LNGQFYNNFPGVENISYAAAVPWDASGNKIGFWKAIVDASTPVMADQGPRNGDTIGGKPVVLRDVTSRWSSLNHGNGQVVGWSDAHAGFEMRSNIGYNNDNIWTHNEGSPSETGRAPIYGPGADKGATSRSIRDYTSGGAIQNWDILMAPSRGTDGKVY
jgi:hypothetical protein